MTMWAATPLIAYFCHVALLATGLQYICCLTNMSFRHPPEIGRNKYRQLARPVHALYSLHPRPGHHSVALYIDIPHT